MSEFEIIGSRELVAPLIDQLSELGATEAASTGSLLLIGVDNQFDAEKLLEGLTVEQRRRSVLVGISGSLEMQIFPRPGSFADLLDRSEVLGAMPSSLAATWDSFGFSGRKDLARPMGVAWLKRFQSKHYAGWVHLSEYPNAGAFLLRLIDASGANTSGGEVE